MSYNVLFIGNSFTFYFDVPELFYSLCFRTGRDVRVEYAVKGGETFEHEADFSTVIGSAVREKLYGGLKYDRIILQEQSSRPFVDYPLFERSLGSLIGKIREAQPQAGIVLYNTWGYADDYAKWGSLPVETDHDKMTSELAEAYERAGARYGVPVVYVGEVFHRLYRETALDPFHTDRKHPSFVGSFASAVTHFLAAFPDAAPEELPKYHIPHTDQFEELLKICFETARK